MSTFTNESTFLSISAAHWFPQQGKRGNNSCQCRSQRGGCEHVWGPCLWKQPCKNCTATAGGFMERCVYTWIIHPEELCGGGEGERLIDWFWVAGILCPVLLFMSLHLHSWDPHKCWLTQHFKSISMEAFVQSSCPLSSTHAKAGWAVRRRGPGWSHWLPATVAAPGEGEMNGLGGAGGVNVGVQ